MKHTFAVAVCLIALLVGSSAEIDLGRRQLLQKVLQGTPATITVSNAKPQAIINAITITPVLPYPQNAYYCNVTGDSGIPQEGPMPLTVRVPVGVTATVVFANITGPIPGTSCTAVQQSTGSSVVQQQQATNLQQMVNNPQAVMQQGSGGGNVVQQNYAASINQQMAKPDGFYNCVANSSSVVQQQGGSSVVQQQGGSSVVQQQGGSSVVQQQGSTSVVQQKSPPSTVVQQQSSPSTVVQQQSPPSTVVQQRSPPSSVVQQSTPGTPNAVVQQGRHLLQAGTIEYISNNGSTGQPQLTVLDTVEGVPNISFKPTAAGQTAVFNGGLQVAITTTNNGFGTPYIPYKVDSKLSPQCNVQINFVSF